MTRLPHLRTTVALSVAVVTLFAAPLEAQLGGLVRRAVQRAAPDPTIPPPGAADTYTEHLLELVPDVLDKVIAGKRAGNRYAAGPQGPAEIRKKRDEVFVRAGEYYDRNQLAIQRGDELASERASCIDDAMHAARERRSQEMAARMMSDRSLQLKIAEVGQKIADAQQRGDTAAIRKLSDEMNSFTLPTAADSTAARNSCPAPAASQEYDRYVAMQEEIKALDGKLEQAMAEISRLEQEASGLTRRQIAMACERINLYRNQVSARKGMKGFSAAELEALEQRQGDLDRLCTG